MYSLFTDSLGTRGLGSLSPLHMYIFTYLHIYIFKYLHIYIFFDCLNALQIFSIFPQLLFNSWNLSKASKANFAKVDISPRDLASSMTGKSAILGHSFFPRLRMVDTISMRITAPNPHLTSGRTSAWAPPWIPTLKQTRKNYNSWFFKTLNTYSKGFLCCVW